MDRSLKKLSRLELLELMVKLSEENDAIAAENAQLKRALSAKPQISRAAKVGSIAELAMQTNGFFEAAQNAADDYLREIKRLRDQMAARAAAAGPAMSASESAGRVPTAQEQAVANATVRDAQVQAQAIMKRANSQAESIVADARAKSEAIIADANQQSRTIIARANRQADAVISAANNDASRKKPTATNPALSAPIRGRHVRTAAEGA